MFVRTKQLTFEALRQIPLKQFGGSLLKNSHAKIKRPISTKRAMHVVLRSTLAKGEWSFLRTINAKRIDQILKTQALRHGVKLYRFANSGNHLHLLILPRSRDAFNSYMRSISGLIARLVTGSERGSKGGGSFWDARPFSRIIEWGREYKSLCGYLLQNTLESIGFLPYRAPKNAHQKVLSG